MWPTKRNLSACIKNFLFVSQIRHSITKTTQTHNLSENGGSFPMDNNSIKSIVKRIEKSTMVLKKIMMTKTIKIRCGQEKIQPPPETSRSRKRSHQKLDMKKSRSRYKQQQRYRFQLILKRKRIQQHQKIKLIRRNTRIRIETKITSSIRHLSLLNIRSNNIILKETTSRIDDSIRIFDSNNLKVDEKKKEISR